MDGIVGCNHDLWRDLVIALECGNKNTDCGTAINCTPIWTVRATTPASTRAAANAAGQPQEKRLSSVASIQKIGMILRMLPKS